MEIAKYDIENGIKEDKCLSVIFTITDYAGEVEIIELDNNNCERFEEHPRFYKIIYKPFKERFVIKEQLVSEGVKIRAEIS